MAKYNKERKLSLSDFVVDGKATSFCWEYISTLSNVVISKYFYKYLEYFDRDDLTSLAISDATAFIIKVVAINDNENNEIKNIRNLLFTRIRNTLSNFIFRSNKLISTADEILDLNVVYPKSFDYKSSDLIATDDLDIDSINSFRSVSLNVWKLFLTNSAYQKYFINDNNNDLSDWKTYSEVHNMKKPCNLINLYNTYSEEQISDLAEKLDNTTGHNYFSILYQLLGDKFLAFLDVFQEDKFSIPSTVLVRHLLTDMSICNDYSNGVSLQDLSVKYKRSLQSIEKIINSKDIL